MRGERRDRVVLRRRTSARPGPRRRSTSSAASQRNAADRRPGAGQSTQAAPVEQVRARRPSSPARSVPAIGWPGTNRSVSPCAAANAATSALVLPTSVSTQLLAGRPRPPGPASPAGWAAGRRGTPRPGPATASARSSGAGDAPVGGPSARVAGSGSQPVDVERRPRAAAAAPSRRSGRCRPPPPARRGPAGRPRQPSRRPPGGQPRSRAATAATCSSDSVSATRTCRARPGRRRRRRRPGCPRRASQSTVSQQSSSRVSQR